MRVVKEENKVLITGKLKQAVVQSLKKIKMTLWERRGHDWCQGEPEAGAAGLGIGEEYSWEECISEE